MTSESRPNSKPVFRSLFLAAAFCLSFLAVSCDFFNASLPEFLEEYTRSVAAESYTLDDTYPRNIYGVHCVPSDRPITIYIRLRNPQRYDLDVSETTVEFKDHFASPPILTVSLDPSTKDVVTVQFGPLNSSEEGITVLVNLRLKREDGLKEFEPYTVSLKCNTVPVMPVAVNYDGTVFTVAGSDQ